MPPVATHHPFERSEYADTVPTRVRPAGADRSRHLLVRSQELCDRAGGTRRAAGVDRQRVDGAPELVGDHLGETVGVGGLVVVDAAPAP